MHPRDFQALFAERNRFVREFGFAVPTRAALDWLCRFSPLLEVGAGTGAWARLLAQRGADIVATDPKIGGFMHGGATWYWDKTYHPVLPLAGKTAVRRWPERNVFCSWPTLGETWLRQAARAMRPGRTLFVVREEATADERTWEYIEHHFEPIALAAPEPEAEWIDNTLELPNWYFVHDRLEAWRKKTRRALAATPPRPGRPEDEEP